MARKQLTGPYSKVTNKNVFPILPLRTQLTAVTTNVTVFETVDLRLTLHENMVMDIMKIETFMAPSGYDESVADGNSVLHAALLDNVASQPNLDTEAEYETNPAFVYYNREVFFHTLGVAGGYQLNKVGNHHVEYFLEPWTVAKNVAWAFEFVNSTAFVLGAIARFIIWGRIRKAASDSEYRDIWERQVG